MHNFNVIGQIDIFGGDPIQCTQYIGKISIMHFNTSVRLHHIPIAMKLMVSFRCLPAKGKCVPGFLCSCISMCICVCMSVSVCPRRGHNNQWHDMVRYGPM